MEFLFKPAAQRTNVEMTATFVLLVFLRTAFTVAFLVTYAIVVAMLVAFFKPFNPVELFVKTHKDFMAAAYKSYWEKIAKRIADKKARKQ
jgi:adenosine/AMP kinase